MWPKKKNECAHTPVVLGLSSHSTFILDFELQYFVAVKWDFVVRACYFTVGGHCTSKGRCGKDNTETNKTCHSHVTKLNKRGFKYQREKKKTFLYL